MLEDLRTPCILIDPAIVEKNLAKMSAYAKAHNLALRPHTKTHKSLHFARRQMAHGAVGLTVAKPGEAMVMADACNDLLMAYPAVTRRACAELAQLAKRKVLRVGIDSTYAADQLSAAASAAGATIGILVDLDVGHHRTGVQSPEDAVTLARHIAQSRGLRLDGIMYFAGQVSMAPSAQAAPLAKVDKIVGDILSAWRDAGFEAKMMSGGSTPSAYQSPQLKHLNEIRPGTYIFNDMNCVHSNVATLDDCAARIIATVISTAVPGQVVIDAGTKTLTSDKCGPAPESGHGHILEYPAAKIAKLNEEHGQVDVTQCDRAPKIGDRVSIIPNHICPCINLQDTVWLKSEAEKVMPLRVDARGRVS